MRDVKRFLLAFGAAAALSLGLAGAASSAADPSGCCCMASSAGQVCSETTEKECLAKQQAAPQYDEKTKYDEALKKSEAEEAGEMKSGWRAGSCPAK
jgi:hypothetical protein